MKNRLAALSIAMAVSAGSLTTSPAWGADCQALLKTFVDTANPSASKVRLRMVTLNNRGVASYTDFASLSYRPGITGPGGIPRPARFESVSGVDIAPIRQLFSDRMVQSNRAQPFDATQSDDLAIEIADSPNVTVTLTLKTWNNTKANFTPSCESGGFMLGKTPDVQYILHLVR